MIGTSEASAALGTAEAEYNLLIDTNTNSLTGPFDLASVTFTVQGAM